MKLFFDARYIRTDFHDGISRYSAELGSALAVQTPITFIICNKAQLKLLPENAEYIMFHAPTSPKEPFASLLLNRYSPDVVFSPMQTFGSFGRRFKLILTLHDLIYYTHRTPPSELHALIRFGWRLYHLTYIPQRLTLNAADAVATVSNASKQAFEAVNLTKRPIVVIPNAAQDLSQYLDTPLIIKKSPKNLIYMGSFMRYKNVEALIAGMEFLPEKTLHLLSRVSPSRKAELKKCIPKNATVIFHGGVSDKAYATLLADDAVLVSASRDEGYGLPLAEAIKMGVPAVVSDLAIHREVAGKAALYFSANRPQEFAERVLELDRAKTVALLQKASQAQAKTYNWHNSAQTLLKTMTSLTKTKRPTH